MDDWLTFKLEAQRLLASAVGANDDQHPDRDAEWAAWVAERTAYLDEHSKSWRRFLLKMAVLLAVGAPLSVYLGTNYGNRIRATIHAKSLRASTALCANQAEMLNNIPVGDYRVVAVLSDGPFANCQWMTDEEYAEMKARPGFRQLTPD